MQARRLEQEARVRAQEWPGRARTELAGKKESLGDAKIDLDERVRDLASLERDLEKADFDARAKAHESKVTDSHFPSHVCTSTRTRTRTHTPCFFPSFLPVPPLFCPRMLFSSL